MRALAALATLLALASSSFAAEDFKPVSLILIQPGVAGTRVDQDLYKYQKWIRWPVWFPPSNSSDLLSLISGVDWLDLRVPNRFKVLDARHVRATDLAQLVASGYFTARLEALHGLSTVSVEKRQGANSMAALDLGIADTEGDIDILPFDAPWPKDRLTLQEAGSWDDVAAAVRKSDRRTLVVEYPPPRNQPWTRFWTYGRGWPEGLPESHNERVPGLIPAREAVEMLIQPESFRWIGESAETWEGANRWLKAGHESWPNFLVATLGASVLLALSAFVCIFREIRSRAASGSIQLLLVLPACMSLAGELARHEGLGTFFLFLPIVVALCGGLLGLTAVLQRRFLPDAHPLIGAAILGSAMLVATDPQWSPLGSRFGWIDTGSSASCVGCLFGYLVSASAFANGSSLMVEWMIRLVLLSLTCAGFALHCWWVPEPIPYALLPVVAALFGDGIWRWPMAALMPAASILTRPLSSLGFSWMPAGEMRSLADVGKIDLSGYVGFLLSPLLASILLCGGAITLFGDRFLLRQMRRLLDDDPRRAVPLVSSAALGIAGLVEPAMLTSALWCAVGGVFVLLHDGVSVL